MFEYILYVRMQIAYNNKQKLTIASCEVCRRASTPLRSAHMCPGRFWHSARLWPPGCPQDDLYIKLFIHDIHVCAKMNEYSF